uniref:Uncharacterized protein n=1 Tax=Oryza brachyantha TaxID=4533 RepID=J3ML76_ORYBR
MFTCETRLLVHGRGTAMPVWQPPRCVCICQPRFIASFPDSLMFLPVQSIYSFRNFAAFLPACSSRKKCSLVKHAYWSTDGELP